MFSAYGLSYKFWRWMFTKAATSPGPVWIDRLWIFDTDGGRVTSGMKYSSASQSTAALSANYARWEYNSSVTNIAPHQNAQAYQGAPTLASVVGNDNLTASLNNFYMCASPVVDPENPDSWLGIGMRFADNAKPVTGYNIMSYETAHYPVSWKVEASQDGVTWTNIETRTNVEHAQPGKYYFYDGEVNTAAAVRGSPVEHFKFGGYKSDGLEADSTKAVSLQVDDGASVDFTAFTVAPQKIGGITVDFAAGGGTIHGGSIAPGGTLYIVNSSQGFVRDSALPIVLDGVGDGANFSSWTVSIDGSPAGKYCAKLNGNGELIVSGMGLLIFVR